MRLKGKVAIITGAGSGIGAACAEAFVREGAKVVLVGRTKAKLEPVARALGASAIVCSADVSNKNNVERIVKVTVEQFKGIHVLVNGAAVIHAGTAESHSVQEWDESFDINVKGLWMLSREVLPVMRKAGGGSIVNFSSVVGLVGAMNRVAYSATKGAVTLLTKAMALDHAAEHIRVNCICPGVVETELVEKFISEAPDPELARKTRVAKHPLGRFGKPEDIAPLAVYLASDESSWVTGAAFPIDGGYTAI
ncbi:MAG TPA: SDR family oxidoreductase [Terriglobales bacterium]|nr:SDR family oxidoreductase [Terriglobales bacterium]